MTATWKAKVAVWWRVALAFASVIMAICAAIQFIRGEYAQVLCLLAWIVLNELQDIAHDIAATREATELQARAVWRFR